jgi:hypothetical protein
MAKRRPGLFHEVLLADRFLSADSGIGRENHLPPRRKQRDQGGQRQDPSCGKSCQTPSMHLSVLALTLRSKDLCPSVKVPRAEDR